MNTRRTTGRRGSGGNHGQALAEVCWLTCGVLLAQGLGSAFAAELRIGQATGLPGESVSIPVTYTNASPAAGMQFDMSFDSSSVELASVSAGSGLAGHVLDQQQMAPGQWRVLVYSITNGPIAPGTVAWLNFAVHADAVGEVVPLEMSNAVAAEASGRAVQPLAQMDGLLMISAPERLVVSPLGTGGRLVTTILGLPGRVFTLQGGPDMFHWANLSIHTNQSGTVMLTNLPPAGQSTYFYRTVSRSGTNLPVISIPSLSGATRRPDGSIRFQLNSAAGSIWRIEGSPDLVHWGDYGVVTNSTGELQITNTPIIRPDAYFFRAALP